MPFAALLRRCLATGALLLSALTAAADGHPQKCQDRPHAITGELITDYLRWCVESVIDDPSLEPLAFTALEMAPDGSLFAARPLAGEVAIIEDSDGDDLPDRLRTYAAGLSLPNGLAYHGDALYVSGGGNIYRIAADGAVETIVSDLPFGAGHPAGGLVIGEDERLYLAMGAPCDHCLYDPPERGAILSMRLDGTDRQIVASGFRRPADVEFYRGDLWTLDSAPRGYDHSLALDELNRVEAGGWYGFPYCLGRDHIHIATDVLDCAAAIAPTMLFGAGARPNALAAYPHDTMTGVQDSLIVVMRGEPSQINYVGFKVVMLHFDAADQPLGASILLPFRIESRRQAYTPYAGEGLFWQDFITLGELGWGIYPQQPLALAVNERGWIYVSITGGRIVVLKPANQPLPWEDFYPRWTPMHPDFAPGG